MNARLPSLGWPPAAALGQKASGRPCSGWRDYAPSAVMAVLLAAALGLWGLPGFAGTDYEAEAAEAFGALAAWDLEGFLAVVPAFDDRLAVCARSPVHA